jgi:pyridoxamine 5'-phosphate oxidase
MEVHVSCPGDTLVLAMVNDDPIGRFSSLYERAKQILPEADAMVLSTVDADGWPSGRFVLLKSVDSRGFVFFTNLDSRKAQALHANPRAALCFYWPVETQIRVEGTVERVDDAEADQYFATRQRESQIGAWASIQSAPLASRQELDDRVAQIRTRFANQPVPRPAFWSGFRVVPRSIEFWTRDPARLHERMIYQRQGDRWVRSLLNP